VISSASITDSDRASPRYSSVLSVEAWDRDEIAAAGMGALAAVARGSHEEPQLIVLRYEPPDAAGLLVAAVGKGVTSTRAAVLKPKESLTAEKYDMSGGAAVLAAIGAIAELSLRSGWSACRGLRERDRRRGQGAGRRPARARRHDDRDGHTNAEGRLVLADCLAYARREGAERLVDVATLTCGAVTALGFTHAALFVNNEDWAVLLQAAAEQSGERVWRLPLHRSTPSGCAAGSRPRQLRGEAAESRATS
jgi:leucyl aminopeptidase